MTNGELIIEEIKAGNADFDLGEDYQQLYDDFGWHDSWPDGWTDSHRRGYPL